MVAVVQIADLHAEAGLIEDGFGRGDVEAGHVVYLEGCERLRGGLLTDGVLPFGFGFYRLVIFCREAV